MVLYSGDNCNGSSSYGCGDSSRDCSHSRTGEVVAVVVVDVVVKVVVVAVVLLLITVVIALTMVIALVTVVATIKVVCLPPTHHLH